MFMWTPKMISTAFFSWLALIGFCQSVYNPAPCFSHTLDLVLLYGIEIEHLIVFPQIYLITSEFLSLDLASQGKNSYTRCLSDSAVAKFISLAFSSVPCLNITEGSYADLIPFQTDRLVDSAACTLQMTLAFIAPLKGNLIKQRRLAPWYNPQTCRLKQT